MNGRIAIVTGGSRGLGRAIALRLAEQGAVLAIVHQRDRAAADEALAAIRVHSPSARAYPADISDRAAIDEAVAKIRAELGPIEILVNNAYRPGRTPKKTHEIDPIEFAEDIQTNLVGQFHVTRAVLPSMLDRGFGRIVFIGSLAIRGERGRLAYVTAKNGLIGMMKTIALEYAKDGVTANMVSPGFLDAGAFLRFSTEIRERALARVPSKRPGRPEEVAAAVAYLCSDEAAYTTGQILGVDGGAA
jgi:NAD(P)-dependent dehydrogenase (short-subunit alcohol dehydrogenase family)